MHAMIPGGLNSNPIALGMIFAIMAATAYGSSQFLARRIVTEHAPPLVVATVALFVGFLVLTALANKNIVKDRHAPRKALLFLVLSGIAASSGVAFNYSALSLAPVVVVAPVSSVSPLISLSLAHIFLQQLERITLRIWIGAFLVVAGVILVTLGSAV